MTLTMLADVPTIGLFIGYGAAVVAVLCIAAGVIVAVKAARERDHFDRGDMWLLTVILLTVGVLTALAALIGMWPLKYDYHHYVTKTGTVQTIDKRLVGVGSDSGASERYVIRTPEGETFGVDDTRAGALRPGDKFGIKCKKEHQWFQPYEADGFACRWGA